MANPVPRIAGRILSLNELAGALGKSVMTIKRYVGAGMPCEDEGGRGRAAKFHELKCRAWLADRERKAEPVGNGAKQRFALAAAELKEMQLARMRLELVPVGDITRVLGEELTAFRVRMMEMPGRLSPVLLGMTDRGQIERLIDAEVQAALGEISADYRPTDVIDPDNG
jgi:hypothetical protein